MQNGHQHTNILRFMMVTSFLLDTLSLTLIWSSRSPKKSFSYRGSQIMEFSFVQSEDKIMYSSESFKKSLCALGSQNSTKSHLFNGIFLDASVNQSEYSRVNSSLQTDKTLTRHAHKLQPMAWR